MTAFVLTLTVVVPLLALWAAYITTALAAECDIRDDYGPGRLVWVWLHLPAPLEAINAPVSPLLHHLVLAAEVQQVEPALLYRRPPVHAAGEVRRVAA